MAPAKKGTWIETMWEKSDGKRSSFASSFESFVTTTRTREGMESIVRQRANGD